MSVTADEIAVIGMACRFPGANSPEQFWANLRDGKNCITFFSKEELKGKIRDDVLQDESYVRARGVLDDIEHFDADFFSIGAREARLMDPQQRLFLECAWIALEDAGCDPLQYPLRIGVFASAATNFYVLNQFEAFREAAGSGGSIQAFLASERDFLPSRVAYKLNLRGPAINVQTACSSSLVAVHLACQSLLNYECDTAIAGGVSIAVPHRVGYAHDSGGISSPDGYCRAFDKDAQGSVGGSGVGIVVLKRLDEAMRDGDLIRAVVKGSAINNDGAAKVGYTAPGMQGQAQVILDALSAAGLGATDISYVEAHGTGTPLGDPIEVAALSQVFLAGVSKPGTCALGSVKTNIGHLDAAAGIAGFMKTVLALQHKTVPPSLNFKIPNPELRLEAGPFFIPTQSMPWTTDGPRRAGVSSFGIGGTNAHVIMEEAPPAPQSEVPRERELLVLSARNKEALEQRVAELKTHLAIAGDSVNIADVAHTLQSGRAALPYRCFAVCHGAGRSTEEIHFSRQSANVKPLERAPEIAFLFPGQASQRVSMAQGLYDFSQVFRQTIDECCERVQPLLGFDLRRILWPRDEDRQSAEEKITRTDITQPAVFIIDYAVARLWMELGVTPQAVLGHSLGEFVAACIAGVLELNDALKLVVERGRLMGELPQGRMLAVGLSEDQLQPLLGPELSVAAVNGSELTVVSGAGSACDELERRLAERKVSVRPLRTSHAFHSCMMDPILPRFSQVVKQVRMAPPSLRYVSNLTGDWISQNELSDPEYWVRHLRRTVRFDQGLNTLLQSGVSLLIEAGPGSVLSGLAAQHPSYREGQTTVATMPHVFQPLREVEEFLAAIGRVWVAGANIRWQPLQNGRKLRKVSLPAYPFVRRRYWIDPLPAQAKAGDSAVSAISLPSPSPKKPPAAPPNGKSTPLHSLVERQLQLLTQQISLLKQRH
jgi:acyl transferase domain-containing protein